MMMMMKKKTSIVTLICSKYCVDTDVVYRAVIWSERSEVVKRDPRSSGRIREGVVTADWIGRQRMEMRRKETATKFFVMNN